MTPKGVASSLFTCSLLLLETGAEACTQFEFPVCQLQGRACCGMHDEHQFSAGHYFSEASGHALGHPRAVVDVLISFVAGPGPSVLTQLARLPLARMESEFTYGQPICSQVDIAETNK